MRIAKCFCAGIMLLCGFGPDGYPSQNKAQQKKAPGSYDLTLTETTTISGAIPGSPGEVIKSTNYFGKDTMRRSSPMGFDMIIRMDQGQIITINHKEKTFSSVTIHQINAEIDKAAGELTEDKVQMDTIRDAIGKSMSSVTITKVGPGEIIAGYKTEKYSVRGPMEIDIWAAPEVEVPPLYYESLKMSVDQNPMFDIRKLLDEFKKIGGMTLKSVQNIKVGNTAIVRKTVVTSVKKAPIPKSAFDVPVGYREVPSEVLK
jgi:hypothetical protein